MIKLVQMQASDRPPIAAQTPGPMPASTRSTKAVFTSETGHSMTWGLLWVKEGL